MNLLGNCLFGVLIIGGIFLLIACVLIFMAGVSMGNSSI